MRLVCAGIGHETNTYAHKRTTLADFVDNSGGDPGFPAPAILDRYAGTDTIVGGALDAARQEGAELVPVFHAVATAGGTVEHHAYETIKRMMLERLKAALPADGVLLDLHGAMATEQIDDVEGDIAKAVRALVGSETPIVMTLDLHANISASMAHHVDALIGFDTYPHVDMRERGVEATILLARMARRVVRAQKAFRQIPLLTLPPLQCTLREPMASILDALHALERNEGVLTATLSCGFPFADVPDAGMSVFVATDGRPDLAERLAEEFSRYVFARRDEFTPVLTPVSEAIRIAREEAAKPVILADGSDNPGGGAPADGTVILAELLRSRVDNAVIGVIADPATVAAAHAAGAGKEITVTIGGKTDRLHGEPVRTTAYVRLLSDGEFEYRGPMGRGTRGHLGRTAVLVVGGVEIVVAEKRVQLMDQEMLRFVGIEPSRKRLIVVKSAVHFRADFGPIAARILDADTPGVHRPDFSNYLYRKVRRPIYPLDAL